MEKDESLLDTNNTDMQTRIFDTPTVDNKDIKASSNPQE